MTGLRDTVNLPVTEHGALAFLSGLAEEKTGQSTVTVDRSTFRQLVRIAEAGHEASRRPFGQLYERDHYKLREELAALERLPYATR